MCTTRGFPPLFASLVSIPVILVPWMLGYLAWEDKRRTGRFRVIAAVIYRERLAPRHYVHRTVRRDLRSRPGNRSDSTVMADPVVPRCRVGGAGCIQVVRLFTNLLDSRPCRAPLAGRSSAPC